MRFFAPYSVFDESGCLHHCYSARYIAVMYEFTEGVWVICEAS